VNFGFLFIKVLCHALKHGLEVFAEGMAKHLDEQKSEVHKLRLELQAANRQTVEANRKGAEGIKFALKAVVLSMT
jgi:hypothetical protein